MFLQRFVSRGLSKEAGYVPSTKFHLNNSAVAYVVRSEKFCFGIAKMGAYSLTFFATCSIFEFEFRARSPDEGVAEDGWKANWQ